MDHAVAERLRLGESILYVGTCNLGTWAVILIAGAGAAAWTAHGKSTAELAPVLRGLQLANGATAVSAALRRAGTMLAPVLSTVSRIVASSDIHRLAVIAGGPLAGLPLGALDHGAGTLDAAITIRYLTAALTKTPAAVDDPAAAEAAAVAEHGAASASWREPNEPASSPPGLSSLSIVDPTGDLVFAATEIDAVRRFAPDVLEPTPGRGTRGWLLDMLPGARHLHMACHAVYEPADPLASRFVLGDRLWLTVADLDAIDLSSLDLVVASCCQSGVVDGRAADELVGLAHALIAAGPPVSSLRYGTSTTPARACSWRSCTMGWRTPGIALGDELWSNGSLIGYKSMDGVLTPGYRRYADYVSFKARISYVAD